MSEDDFDDSTFDEDAYLEVQVDAIALSPKGLSVILRPPRHERMIPILIGAPEAQAIALGLAGQAFPRPLTHDLFKQVLDELGVEVSVVSIETMEDDTFFASLHLDRDGIRSTLDSRPSDALALAVRFGARVLVARDLWDRESVPAPDVEGATEAPDVLASLRARLDEAIAEEKYEEAARLRDEIRSLEGGN